jgi:hypothetical protein
MYCIDETGHCAVVSSRAGLYAVWWIGCNATICSLGRYLVTVLALDYL